MDQVNLFGYGTSPVAQQVTGAGIVLALADNTGILLAGITQPIQSSIAQG